MAYLRTATNDGVGQNYLRVLVDGFSGTSYSSIVIYNYTTGQSYNASYEGAGRSTVQTFAGLTAGTTYAFYAYATPTGSTARRIPESGYEYFTTTGSVDNTPTVNINSYSGANALSISWYASDDKGLRTYDTFALYVSGADDSNLQFETYTNGYDYTFTSDGYGNPLKANSVYLVRVVVVDNNNQTSYDDRYITYTTSRPQNFSWANSKSIGSPYNLTSTEWNSLLDKINEFREYKGFTPFSFNRNISNGKINNYVVPTASSFNAAINGINSMSPTVSPPSSVYSGQNITANHFNRLRDSLNSIN